MIDINRFRQQFVLVVGDMMVDTYVSGSVERISPEAPVSVLRQHEVKHKLGGAGNVIANLASLGASIRAVGCIGDDEEGTFFRQAIHEYGVDDKYLFTCNSTIVKTRVSAANQQLIRIDRETITSLSEEMTYAIESQIVKVMQGITVVIISDYNKGLITEKLSQLIIQSARERKIPVLVDPKGKDTAKYRGATAITPNSREFLDLSGLSAVPSEDDIRLAALQLCTAFDFDYLICTRSELGISIIGRADNTKRDYPAIAKEVVDVTGAGDTVISVIALGIGAGFDLDACAELANLAASAVIMRFGTAQITIEELSSATRIDTNIGSKTEAVFAQIHALHDVGKRIVFTNGCFDILHAGHIRSFMQARRFGDILVVGINSDDSIRRIKGNSRPIINLHDRMILLASLECVDFVIPFDEDTPQKLIEEVRPDVLVKGKDWEKKGIAGEDYVRSYGGRTEFVELEPGLSTTGIIKKIAKISERGYEV